MVREKDEFNGKCHECNGADFEMIAGLRVSAKYSIKIVGHDIVSADFEEITDIDVDNIEEGSEFIQCAGCGCEIPMDDVKNESIKNIGELK